MKKLFLTFLFSLNITLVLAADISFQATVNSNQVTLNDAIQLNLTVANYKDSLDPISLPAIDSFDVQYVGPSTSVSIVNGSYSSQRSFIYHLIPSKTGRFKIPAITVNLEGKDYFSTPIDIEVTDAPTQPLSADNPQSATSESLQDKIILKMSVPTSQVILNDRLILTLRLYVREIPMRDIDLPKIEADGFTLGAYEKPTQSSELLNGINYDAVTFRVPIYPNRLGPLTIAPAKLSANLLFNKPRGNDFLDSFFSNYVARPVTVTSNNLMVDVQSLPQGAPEGFNGAVGQYEFSASVSPLEVNVGDPLTLRMAIKGEGNYKNLKFPQISNEHLKVYEPTIKDLPDGKELEQVIIPLDEQATSIGPLNFVYYDALASQYKTITQGPFAIKVNKPAQGQEFKAVGFKELDTKPVLASELLQEGFFKKIWDGVVKFLTYWVKNIWFWVSLVGAGLLLLGYRLWRNYQKRMNTDTAFARRIKAFKGARQGIEQAKAALGRGDVKSFYEALHKTINNYFADKMHKGLGAVSVADIEVFLNANGINGNILDSLKSILGFCEAVRFGGGSADPSRMQDDFNKLQELLASIEKKIR